MPNIWTKDTITPRLAEMAAKVDARMIAVSHKVARDLETHAKQHAPWTDRTSNARNGLHADVAVIPFKAYTITLSHSVSYGIWLEIRWSGRYAIIMPTIQNELPSVRELISGMMDGLGI